MPNYDENISFKQGSDNNDADAASIVPVADAEVIWSGTTNRPVENLRSRTEVLRRAVQDLLYYADYDRSLLLRSEALFSVTEPVPASGEFELVATSDLYVYPALTPGRFSGGRHLGGRVFFGDNPYLGPSAVDALVFTASSASTGQRGYFDGDSLSDPTVLTTGANRIALQIQFNASAATGTFTFAVTGTPRTQILVTCGTQSGVPNHAQFIAAFNADVTSQGTFGVANLLRVASTAVTPGSVAVTTGNGVAQGAYDAEAHLVTQAQLAAFFAAVVSGVNHNRLRDGEGLAIAFPPGPVQEYVGPGYPRGGRRQAIFDLPTDRAGFKTTNTTPPTGYSLFNTGREPEKIPGSVPIGKLLQQGGVTEFVFIDGSRIRLGDAPAPIGAAGPLRRLLAAITPGSSGASLVGYDGSGNWNADAATPPTALPAGTVENALDAVVAQLGDLSTNTSGARRVGFEGVSGVASVGNTALNAISGSLRAALADLLNNSSAGINRRVLETGHRMTGLAPLQKRFEDLATSTGGGRFIQSTLNSPGNLFSLSSQKEDLANLTLLPFAYNNSSTVDIPLNNPVTGVLGGTITFSTLSQASATFLSQELVIQAPYTSPNHRHVVVEIKNDPLNAGFYFLESINFTVPVPTCVLCSLDGLSALPVTPLSGATLTFYKAHIEGNSQTGVRGRKTIPSVPGVYADEQIYGNGVIRRGHNNLGQQFSETVLEASWSEQDTAGTGNAGTAALTFTNPSTNIIQISGLANMVSGPAGSAGHLLLLSTTGPLSVYNGKWEILTVINATTVYILSSLTVTGTQSVAWSELYPLVRTTNRILALDDFRLLNGVESGTPKDATPGHHHNSAYSKTDLVQIPLPLSGANDLLIGLAAGNYKLDATGPSYIKAFSLQTNLIPYLPAGCSLVGYLVDIVIEISLNSALGGILDSVLTRWDLKLITNPGLAYDVNNTREIWRSSAYKVTATGVPQILSFSSHAPIFVDSLGVAYVNLAPNVGSAFDLVNTFAYLRPAALLYRRP